MAGVPVRVLIADDKELSVAATTAAMGARDGFELVGVALCADQAGEFAQATRPGRTATSCAMRHRHSSARPFAAQRRETPASTAWSAAACSTT
jgi:hypothetical protein